MTKLPIADAIPALQAAVSSHGRVLLRAPTGSGKSTQVPQVLVDAGLVGRGRVVVLQPRRIAARMLAARVAWERGVKVGGEVGYQVRMEKHWSDDSRIVYVTEGILLRWMLSDPKLDGISAVIFDEFHERHLYGDVTLARALDLQESARPDLKILVMSATLEHASLQAYLDPCCLVESAGRTYPVEIEYLQREPDSEEPIWDRAARHVARAQGETDGNVLVFMPGAYEIQRTIQAIQARVSDIAVLPLHGELPSHQQDQAVAGEGIRRIIVSTNVAETSLTIDGVTLVVDCGFARVARYDAGRAMNTLYIEKISRSSADQRAGRAGRTAPGRCLRLWTQRDHERRPESETPEILRMDLAETVLALKASGIREPSTFRWLEPPDPKALTKACELLEDLGAVGQDGEITKIGRRMLSFPVHPRYARMFLAADALGCVRAAALIAALTQNRNLLMRADRRTQEARDELFGDAASDFQIAMRAWAWADRQGYRTDACRRLAIHADSARQVGRLFEQMLAVARSEGLGADAGAASDEAIAKCVLAGFADQVARRRSAGSLLCDVVHGRRGMLAKGCVVQDSRLVVAAEIHDIEGRGGDAQVTLSMVTGISEDWLRELFPGDFSDSSELCYDQTQNRVVRRTSKKFRDLVLDTRDRDAEPSSEVAAVLARHVVDGELKLKMWDDQIEQWIHRVNALARWMPDLGIPGISDGDREILIAEVCAGATCYRDIKDKPVRPAIEAWLSGAQRAQVDRMVPERLELPGGRKAKITYSSDGAPTLGARIQDLYDVKGELTICGGRIPLRLEVLAPNFRPVQITDNLKTFWESVYPSIKGPLQRRYPKHEWR